MRFIRSRWDPSEWFERLAVNVNVLSTVLGSIPASSDTVESEGRQMKQLLNNVHKKKKKSEKSPFILLESRKKDLLVFFPKRIEDGCRTCRLFTLHFFKRGRWSMVWTSVGLFCAQLHGHKHRNIPTPVSSPSPSFPQLTVWHTLTDPENDNLWVFRWWLKPLHWSLSLVWGWGVFSLSLLCIFFASLNNSSLSHIKAILQSFQECYIYRSVFCQEFACTLPNWQSISQTNDYFLTLFQQDFRTW